ncbi:calumenin-B [Trichonephila inaurata madagascariensis]|uniref:Reticulocalbin-3 n=1 Tax=Trichonephila inaurata madagascariensis TaxID=2747483 RepID=A0A8X7C6W3_9ARAC|nr:calumenin-B [Trichonephila inaurata madagascariensis]
MIDLVGLVPVVKSRVIAMSRNIVLLVSFVVFVVCRAVPNPEGNKRVVDKPLSVEKHYDENEAHNAQYDHEAFLGEEEARKFDELSPEESKERLGIIVDKIDKNKDGFVTQEELKDWITYTQAKYITDDVDKQWKLHNEGDKENLDWETFKKVTYNFVDEVINNDDEPDLKSYKEMMIRDKRRWAAADKNKDNKLSKEEFGHFLHPEEYPHMQEVVITETIEDIDKDGDGKISIQEYIGDMYSGGEEDEPEWVKNEREQFETYRDKNKDGYMDKDEVREWILPSDYNHSEAESLHLMHEADDNRDNKLTKEEVLNNYDLFVGSQATDFGEALTRHDEF